MRLAILVPFAVFLFTTLTLPGHGLVGGRPQPAPPAAVHAPRHPGAPALPAHRASPRRPARAAGAWSAAWHSPRRPCWSLPLLFVVTWLFFIGPASGAAWPDAAPLPRHVGSAGRGRGAATSSTMRCRWKLPCEAGSVATRSSATHRHRDAPHGAAGSGRRTLAWKPLGAVDSLADPHPIVQLLAARVVAGGRRLLVRASSRGAWRGWALLGRRHRRSRSGCCWRPGCRSSESRASRPSTATSPTSGSWPRSQSGSPSLPVAASGTRFRRRLDAPPLMPSIHRSLADLHQPTLAVVASGRGRCRLASCRPATYRERWADNPGKDYFANALPDLRALVRRPGRLRRARCLRAWSGSCCGPPPCRRGWSRPAGIEFDSSMMATRPQTSSTSGTTATSRRRRSRASRPSAAAGRCGWQVGATPTTLASAGARRSTGAGWSSCTTWRPRTPPIELEAGDTTTEVSLPADERVVYVAVEGEIDERRADLADSKARRVHHLATSSGCRSRWSGDGDEQPTPPPVVPRTGDYPELTSVRAIAALAVLGDPRRILDRPLSRRRGVVVGAAGLRRRACSSRCRDSCCSARWVAAAASTGAGPDGVATSASARSGSCRATGSPSSSRSPSCSRIRHAGLAAFVRSLTFTQVYGGDFQHRGLTQMWSLCVEVAFYLLLPLVAWLGLEVMLPQPVATADRCCSIVAAVGLITPALVRRHPRGRRPGHLIRLLAAGVSRTGSPSAWPLRCSPSASSRRRSSAAAPRGRGALPALAGWSPLPCSSIAATPAAGDATLVPLPLFDALTKNLLYAAAAGLMVAPDRAGCLGQRRPRLAALAAR